MNFIDILFASLLANNLVFFHFFGLSEFLTEKGKDVVWLRTLTIATVLVPMALLFWFLESFFLGPLHLEVLRTLALGLVLFAGSGLYWLVRPLLEGPFPSFRELTLHSLLMGAVLAIGVPATSGWEVIVGALAVSAGYAGSWYLVQAISSRIARERVPSILQGLPLQLVTLGIVWLVLQGLSLHFAGSTAP